MGVMIGRREQAHVRVRARNIQRWLVARLYQRQCSLGVGNGAAGERDPHALAITGDGNRVLRAREFHDVGLSSESMRLPHICDE